MNRLRRGVSLVEREAGPDQESGARRGDRAKSSAPRGRRSSTTRAAWAVAVIALVCQLILETTLAFTSETRPWALKGVHYVAFFLLGLGVLMVVVSVALALLGRVRTTAVLCVVVASTVAAGDVVKLRLRSEPVYPADAVFLRDAGFLSSMVSPVVLGISVLALAVAGALAHRFGTWLERKIELRGSMRRHLLARAVVGTIGCLSLVYLAHFNAPHHAVRLGYEAAGAKWRPWSQHATYLANGFVGGFLYNTSIPTPPPPAGYSREEMRRIVGTYREEARAINAQRAGTVVGKNIVFVLSESFSDPTSLRDVDLARDPIPTVRRLQEDTASGSMLSQSIGGGTANMEFEALTGMRMSLFPPQVGLAYQSLVPNFSFFPSVVAPLADVGTKSVAIHPYKGDFYKRRQTYASFGFDRFLTQDEVQYDERVGRDGFISDESAFKETLRVLEDERSPVFVNLVTMQNHLPYQSKYSDPVSARTRGEANPVLGQYGRGLSLTDTAVDQFIRRLTSLDEDTVVVFYGDHLPALYDAELLRGNGFTRLHSTPFFVWANFPGPRPSTPLVSPSQFFELVLERADAKVSPQQALMTRLRAAVPAQATGHLYDEDGSDVRRDDLPSDSTQLLRDLSLVQYDLSYGERYAFPEIADLPRE